jgi:hypothetical protein
MTAATRTLGDADVFPIGLGAMPLSLDGRPGEDQAIRTIPRGRIGAGRRRGPGDLRGGRRLSLRAQAAVRTLPFRGSG